ncbi:MAG TPA: potassium channel family protein [Rubrobacteraceae bacterium]|nr:potassium channel family protein [Rubrobacteraceae bacterium]
MEWLLLPVGVILILTGLTDVFFTVLHYDGFGFLSSRLYNRLFHVVSFVTRPLPGRYRALGLSLAAPLMVPVTIFVWILLVSSGYALIYYAGMDAHTFYFSNSSLEPSLLEAFYLSGTAISTLGFGDVTPLSAFYQLLTVSEALIGFGILTLAITYVLGVYGVLQQLGILAAGLYHQAQDTSEPLDILIPHFPNGEHRGLETHLMAVHRELVEIYEGIRRYPIVYYYHSRRAYRSLPYTFRMLGGMAAALRWGLPKDHPGAQTPWLPTLITGLDNVTSYLDERFLSEHLEESPEPVQFETFEAAYSRGKEPADKWLSRFIQITSYMCEMVLLDSLPDAREAYERYTEWLPFAHRNREFFEASARDLGYELEDLDVAPGKRLF